MTIYGEFLFMENAVSGAVILMLTGKLCGCRKSAGAILAGSVMCGVYSFILFADIHWMIALMSKLVFSAAVVMVVFRPQNLRSLGKTAAIFYISSFLMGGITIALMYMTEVPGVAASGSLYLYGVRYLQIMTGILITAAAGSWLSAHLKEKACREAVMTDITIHIGEKSWELKAFVDTGNFLKDPVSGCPAVLISASAGRRILHDTGDESDARYCAIPYRSVGKKGVLHGMRPDRICIGEHAIRKVVLAFNEEDFAPWNGTHGYDVMLQQQLFEGRI